MNTTTAANRGSRYNEEKQGHYNYDDALGQFKTAMLEAGINPPDSIVGDGNLHRFKINGKLNGWYVLHLNGRPAGSFGDWKTGEKHTWKQAGQFIPLSDFQRAELAKKRQADEAVRQAEEATRHAEAAKKAAYVWNNATPAPANHPYLVKKRIKPHGAKLGRENALILPLYNKHGELVNLQFITESGGKRFLSGGLKKSCFHCLGSDTKKILICEGFATGVSLFEDSGYMVIIAFDAGNLGEVAINISAIYPGSEIVICADNDNSGIGEKKAREAALAINCKYIIPPALGDFNDMLSGGLI